MKKPRLYLIIMPIIKFIVNVLNRPQYINTENIPVDGPIILCGNHVHAFDPLLAAFSTKRVVYFLAKKELFRYPILSTVLRSFGTIPVNRQEKDKNTTDTAQEYLNQGKALVILPEGTRNRTNELLLPFKYGSVSLAKKTGALIIPFAIVGKYKLFRRSVKIVFGDPIDISNIDLEEANQFLMDSVKELIESYGDKK